MMLLAHLLANGLVVFGAVVTLLVLAIHLYAGREDEMRARELATIAWSTPRPLPFPVARPACNEESAHDVVPGERLLLASAVERVPADREDILRRISVGHLQAAHPVFQRTEVLAETGTHPVLARRSPGVSRHGRRTRTGQAPLALVRRESSPMAARLS